MYAVKRLSLEDPGLNAMQPRPLQVQTNVLISPFKELNVKNRTLCHKSSQYKILLGLVVSPKFNAIQKSKVKTEIKINMQMYVLNYLPVYFNYKFFILDSSIEKHIWYETKQRNPEFERNAVTYSSGVPQALTSWTEMLSDLRESLEKVLKKLTL